MVLFLFIILPIAAVIFTIIALTLSFIFNIDMWGALLILAFFLPAFTAAFTVLAYILSWVLKSRIAQIQMSVVTSIGIIGFILLNFYGKKQDHGGAEGYIGWIEYGFVYSLMTLTLQIISIAILRNINLSETKLQALKIAKLYNGLLLLFGVYKIFAH